MVKERRPLCGVLQEEDDTEDRETIVRGLYGAVDDNTTEEGYICRT